MASAFDGANECDEMCRSSPVPLAVVDISSMRLTPNRAFTALLGLSEDGGTRPKLDDLVLPEDWPAVQTILAAVATGLVESCQGRGRWRLPGGGEIDVLGWVGPFDGSGPRSRALLAVAPAESALASAEPSFGQVDTRQVALGSLDHDWHISEISPDAAELLGWHMVDYRGSPLQSAVHPDDVPLLLLTLGRSGAERRAIATRLKVRGLDGEWTPVRCAVSPLCDHNPARFGFGLWLLSSAGDLETANERSSRLEGHLWRIAAEVQAADIGRLPQSGEAWWADPAIRGLSKRQSEILRRLILGERAPAIARSLFLSEHTVRNHLSAIYRKVGVHSQSELLARFIGAAAVTNA